MYERTVVMNTCGDSPGGDAGPLRHGLSRHEEAAICFLVLHMSLEDSGKKWEELVMSNSNNRIYIIMILIGAGESC